MVVIKAALNNNFATWRHTIIMLLQFPRFLTSFTSKTNWQPGSFSVWPPGRCTSCWRRSRVLASRTYWLRCSHLFTAAQLPPVCWIPIFTSWVVGCNQRHQNSCKQTVGFSEKDDSQTCVEEWELTGCVEDIQKVNISILSNSLCMCMESVNQSNTIGPYDLWFFLLQVWLAENSPSPSLLKALHEVLPVVFALFCFTKHNVSHLR